MYPFAPFLPKILPKFFIRKKDTAELQIDSFLMEQ